MFNSVLSDVLSTVGNIASKNNAADKSDGNFKIKGHINNCPIDIRVEKGNQSSASPRPAPNASHQFKKNKNTSPNVPNMNKKPNNSANKKQNGSNNNNKVCQVIIPHEGNYEVNIKKFESDSTKKNASSSGNTQKQNFGNTSKQNSNQQKQQSGKQQQNQNQKQQIQKQQNVPQKQQQNGNEKQQQTGNQKQQQNGNQKQQQNGNQKQQQNRKGKQQNDDQLQKLFVKINLGNQNNGSFKPRCNAGNAQRCPSFDDQSTLMYLGRLKMGTTDFETQIYLQQKFPGFEFTVEPLPLYKDAKLPSFKVKVDNRILDEFQNLGNWPDGVKITKFNTNFRAQ